MLAIVIVSFTHANNKYKEFYGNPKNVLADIQKNEQALGLRFRIVRLLLHDEMFQKKWEESELKQLIDTLRRNERFAFEHLRYYPRQ